MKEFYFSVTEHEIGIADDTRKITVAAMDLKQAVKKLRRYLENSYEDKITYSPHGQWTAEGTLLFNKGWITAHLHRNAGHLTIIQLETKTRSEN